MKRKTFFATLLLFLFFINTLLLIISLSSIKDKLSAAKERCLAEHFIIASALINDIQSLESRGGDPSCSMSEIMEPYTRFSQSKTMSLAVSLEESWVYYNSPESPLHDMMVLSVQTQPVDSQRSLFIRKAPLPLLCIYGRLPAPYQDYGLLYTYDLTQLFDSWRSFKNFLFLMGIIVTSLLACCLGYLLEILFRPLRQIAKASHEIAQGCYDNRLNASGSDEIAVMSTSFNQMAEEIELRIRQLQQSAEQKQQFIDNFAHELRTPLTAIYGYAEYIQKAFITEQDKFHATFFIMSECKRLQSMACELLDLAAMREAEISMADFAVSELLEDSRRMMKTKAEQKRIALNYENRLNCLTGNQNLLTSLLNNLVDNAIQASPPDSEIKIAAFYQDGCSCLTVQDQGMGMSAEELSHIKEAFYRADKARSRKNGGAGLGLSICDRIAQLHGAALCFSSSPGAGTLVKILFASQ